MSPEILVFGDTAGQADAFFLTASSSDTADEPLKVCQKGGSQVMSKRCKNDAPEIKTVYCEINEMIPIWVPLKSNMVVTSEFVPINI